MRYTEKGDYYVRKKYISITNITYKGDAEILTSKMIHFIGFYAKGFLDASLNSKGYTDISDIPRLESYLEMWIGAMSSIPILPGIRTGVQCFRALFTSSWIS